jgi:Tfp pilus assembly protein PilO
MNFKAMDARTQLIAVVVLSVMVLGVYTLIRLMPEMKEITRIENKAKSTELKLLKARVPDEPTESLDQVEAELKDIENAITLKIEEMVDIESQLAPQDSQELKVRISQLARQSGVQIRLNEPHRLTYQPKQTKQNKKKKSTDVFLDDAILPPTSPWPMRMAKGTLFERPMQRIELEGSFQSIQQFIYGLSQLPWTVSVLKFNVEKLPNLAPYGYGQPLVTELIIAL